MKNLMEIAQNLLTIDTRYFMDEDIEDINLNEYDLISVFYKKDGVTIIIATEFETDQFGDRNEYDYLFTTGLTKEENSESKKLHK